MPVGNDFYFHYTDTVDQNDRCFPDFEGELQHTDRSPPLDFQVEIRQRTTEQGSPSSIHLRKGVEDRRLDGLPVPDRTGTLIQMNQAASDERGTEENSVVSPILRFSYRLSIVIGLVTAFSKGAPKKGKPVQHAYGQVVKAPKMSSSPVENADGCKRETTADLPSMMLPGFKSRCRTP